jgi:hypothetical protein
MKAICRCSAEAAKVCGTCGGELTHQGLCRPGHHGTQPIRCDDCKRPLCFWHFSLNPRVVDGKVKLLPVCLPSCKHDLRGAEMRPTAVSA